MKREDVTIESQPHKMWAEGKQKNEPTDEEIKSHLSGEGWECVNLETWFDEMMGLWSWMCDIKPI